MADEPFTLKVIAGLRGHGHPSANIEMVAKLFTETSILIWREDAPEAKVNAKDIMELMMLDFSEGTRMVVEAQGDSAEFAAACVVKLLASAESSVREVALEIKRTILSNE